MLICAKDFSEDRRGSSGEFAASLPSDRLEVKVPKQDNSLVILPPDLRDEGTNKEAQKEKRATSEKPLNEKTIKAERRAIQEVQRAAKAAAKDEGRRTSVAAGVNLMNMAKPVKPVPQKKDNPVAASEKKGGDRQPDEDRKKDVHVPHPRMQFDDENRVVKAKKQSVVKQTEAKNIANSFGICHSMNTERGFPTWN